MTIKDLLRGQPTLTQLDILQRADFLFKQTVGRYYGGQLTTNEVNQLKVK